jgi:hypothetical protein
MIVRMNSAKLLVFWRSIYSAKDRTKEVNHKNIREIIANYDVLKSAFAGTGWGLFFED